MVCTCCNADSALRWRVGAMKGGKYGMSALCRWVVTGLGLVGFFHQAMIFEVMALLRLDGSALCSRAGFHFRLGSKWRSWLVQALWVLLCRCALFVLLFV